MEGFWFKFELISDPMLVFTSFKHKYKSCFRNISEKKQGKNVFTIKTQYYVLFPDKYGVRGPHCKNACALCFSKDNVCELFPNLIY